MNRVIVFAVMDSLRELSDIAYQQRVWLASSGPEIASFTEAVCHLFNDSGLGDALEKSGVSFSMETDSRLRLLRSMLSKIDSRRAPSDIIAEPRMQQVRVLAKALLGEIQRSEAVPGT